MDRFRRNKVSKDRRIKALISLIIVGYFLAVGLTYHYQGIHAAIGSVVVAVAAVAISVNLRRHLNSHSHLYMRHLQRLSHPLFDRYF